MKRLSQVSSILICLAGCGHALPSVPRGHGSLGPPRIHSLADDPHLVSRSKFGVEAKRLALDVHLGRPTAEDDTLMWITSNPNALQADRAGLWAILCEDRHRRTLYSAALEACQEASRLGSKVTEDFLGLLRSLSKTPPMVWSARSVRVPISKDSDGTRRVVISHDSGPVEAVIDSGAELAIVMESVARRLGARPIGASSMGTTTTPVAGAIAVIERLRIGSAELRHVPFMILPDAQLTFPDGTSLPMVLGLAALTSAGKAAFLQHGQLLALGDAVPQIDVPPAPLYWDPSGVGFEAGFAKEPRAVHLDTGSRRNYLFPTAERSLGDQEMLTKIPFERKIAGIGGERTEQAFRFSSVTITIGGQPWTFAPMEMAPENDEGEAARIGAPIMDRFETVVLDFDQMRMFVR